MHAINGWMYCNFLAMVEPGKKVRLLIAGFGSEEGLHSPRIVGQVRQLPWRPPSCASLSSSLVFVCSWRPASTDRTCDDAVVAINLTWHGD